MTISSTTNRVSYSGNGATTAFSFPYYFLSSADLVVISRVTATGVETVKTLTTHYTVTGAGVSAGGTVTMLVAPASGTTLTIYRDPAITQDLDLVENDALPAEELEKRLDKLTMISQRLDDLQTRSIRLSDGFATVFDPTLPTGLVAGATIMVNDTADAFEVGPTADEVSNAQTYATNASTSASAAATSASAASTSATNAATSASNAATSEANVLAAIPSQGGNSGKFLTTNGTATSWSPAVADPMTTAGDMLIRNGSNANARLAVGSNGQRLKVSSSALPSWGYYSVVAKSANYTLTGDDEIIEVATAGGAVTITLPAAASFTGKRYVIRKSDSSTNAVTVSTWSLVRQNETLTLYSNGTSWLRDGVPGKNQISLSAGAGYGSTNTKIRYYGNSTTVGSALTVTTNNSTSGASVTVNEDGLYALVRTDGAAAGTPRIGFSLNSASLTTSISSLGTAEVLAQIACPSGDIGHVSVILFLSATDVIRPHDSGSCDRVDARESKFYVVKLNN